jgi:hypothetical protein
VARIESSRRRHERLDGALTAPDRRGLTLNVLVLVYLVVGLVVGGGLLVWAAASEIRMRGRRGALPAFGRDWFETVTGGLRVQWIAFALVGVVGIPIVVVTGWSANVAGLIVLVAMWLAFIGLLRWLLRRRPIVHAVHVSRVEELAERPYVASCESCGWVGRRRPTQQEAALDGRRHSKASSPPARRSCSSAVAARLRPPHSSG